MATDNTQALINRVAKKARVNPANIVGPFNGDQRPVRDGLYLRSSKDTGAACYAQYSSRAGTWGLYSDSKAGAERRAGKRSRKQLQWFGLRKD